MKTKVEISQETAETLIAAGVEVECRYWMFVEAIVQESPKLDIVVSKPALGEVQKKRRKSGLVQRAPTGCIYVISTKKMSLSELQKGLGTSLGSYVNAIVSFVLLSGSKGATRKEIVDHILERHTQLKYRKSPYDSASNFVSKAYQHGLIVVKEEK